MVSMARGSMKMAEAGMPCAAATCAITCASTKWLWAAPPVMISRGATPRSYSRTASVTRESAVGVGFPSSSAGVPRTIIASNRLSEVLLVGAKRRARMAHTVRMKPNATRASAARTSQTRCVDRILNLGLDEGAIARAVRRPGGVLAGRLGLVSGGLGSKGFFEGLREMLLQLQL